jgi:Capsule polysaccharide export protein
LVCGQQPEDAQHNMSEGHLSATFLGIIDRARSEFPKAEIIYRDHPLGRLNVSGYDVYQDSSEKSTEEAISEADVVYTHNSNMGLLALIAGKEVYASEKSLYFQFTKGYSGNNEESLLDFLKRLAHGQFTIDEISSGKALQKVLTSMKVL